jgi:hypothetical protein
MIKKLRLLKIRLLTGFNKLPTLASPEFRVGTKKNYKFQQRSDEEMNYQSLSSK